jgi:hypothetical protein
MLVAFLLGGMAISVVAGFVLAQGARVIGAALDEAACGLDRDPFRGERVSV